MKKENIDISTGTIYPLNAKMQGEVFQQIEPFISCRRYHQLIKQVKYKIEIEYYDEKELENNGTN